ncbi:phage tail family protein [Mammaliicoccus fleurettii]|uniref:Phage tail family protein n=1 Tax=Mammaliicoccus fleurettii TaxID=150056 RepID=A0ABS5MJE9_9STAP|nr:phage tail domain-containing protein [Mammaliicoccus fleurettii]MBL0846523.1 phage tail family protein [Mammaliicoccus fleurettii]MBS3670964.1 phage tail family protein [Mammaliicoccus fleurettii]MBS3696023.1 phage tail family protein [Mammaliicoccus fleurettii]
MTFTLYDPNMNKLDYPVGLNPLDFSVSNIKKERVEEVIDGIPGNVDYGFNYSTRALTLNFYTEHFHGEHDYRLLRNELYALLDSYEYLYISENSLPSRILRITIDDEITPERYGAWYSQVDVPARISGLPFWRTKYTTQDIQTSGYSAIVEKYGTADGIHIDHMKYTHTTNEFTIFNSGNVTIDPRNMKLYIQAKYVNSTSNFTIENTTTGEKFIYKSSLDNYHLILDGAKVKMGLFNRLRDSNRQFISLVPGENKIKISNGTFESITFDSPFYYK